jgi:hypothetical protein
MNNIFVKTKNKFALHAPDCTLHLESFDDDDNFKVKNLEKESGAGCDFYSDLPLIRKVIERFSLDDGQKLNWLDLGCAGGALILEINNQKETDVCIGLDGSVGVYKQESWSSGKNKDILKNADLSKEFFIEYGDGTPVKFDVITCWEVIEHFYENELDIFFTNVCNHLSDGGVFCGSIALFDDIRDENGFLPSDLEFNPNGKVFNLHKTLWSIPKWDQVLSKYFNIYEYDLISKFRNIDNSYYFMCTKKV